MAKVDRIKPYQFKDGQSGNPNGRPKKLSNMLKGIPQGAEQEIYGVFYKAMTLGGIDEAKAELQKHVSEKYGFIYQKTIKELGGKNGWQVLMDILDRLFGKPRQTAEVTHKGGTQIIVNAPDQETAEKLEKL